MRERRRECANCGAKPPKGAKFCPECGRRLGETGSATDTAVLETPPAETGPVPVNVTVAEPRWFGVTPPMLVFALGVAALAAAILLFATGRWPFGLVALGASILLFVAFGEVVQRKPDSAVAQASAGALGALRARAGYAADALATRSRAGRELVRVRRELFELGAARERLLHELGEAVYRSDRAGTKRLRRELTELDARIESKEAEMGTIATAARERIERARLQVQPTEQVEVPEPPAPDPGPPTPAPDPGPPTPAPVPEPSPTPVPEPYPPPDEVTPPEPARVPEPGPLGRARKKK